MAIASEHSSRPLPNQIRRLRLERERIAPGAFSAAALAHRVGVTEGALLQWERGETRPRRRHLAKLARALNVAPEALGLTQAQQ
jgi:transcriptional regulator with XRE-family HTH domain